MARRRQKLWILLIAATLGIGCASTPTADGDASTEVNDAGGPAGDGQGTAIARSEIETVDDVPRLVVNGQPFDPVLTQVYSYPSTMPDVAYGPAWVSGIQAIIDHSVELSTNTLLLHIWWSDLDQADARPERIADNLDFDPVDQVMDYAAARSIRMVLIPAMHKMLPRWWLREKDFPTGRRSPCIPIAPDAQTSCIPVEICPPGDPRCCQRASSELLCCEIHPGTLDRETNGMARCAPSSEPYKACELCETDSYGWQYNYPSMGSDEVRQDYGAYLRAVIERYRSHPALLGWGFGLGSTGEDVYGPDYTQLMMLSQDIYAQAARDQIVDYSPFFRRTYRKWLAAKYQTDEQLRAAWADDTVSLAQVTIAPPAELLVDGRFVFPDNFTLNLIGSLDDLTPKGRDFYAFRRQMKSTDNDEYIALFKELDPQHVLLFSTWNNEDLYHDQRVDGFWSNPRIDAEHGGSHSYIFIMLAQRSATRHGKFAFTILENVYQTASESDEQLRALKQAGQATRCFGGAFGYVSEIERDEGLFDMPSWHTDADREVIRQVAATSPAADCACGIVEPEDRILSRSVNELMRDFAITDYEGCD